jgi:hypothetical protein
MITYYKNQIKNKKNEKDHPTINKLHNFYNLGEDSIQSFDIALKFEI